MPVCPITLLFVPRSGGKSKITFMQRWNSIEISTNEMFRSVAAGVHGGVARSSTAGERLVLSESEDILLKHPSPCTIDSI